MFQASRHRWSVHMRAYIWICTEHSLMKRCATEIWFARALQQWIDVLGTHH